MQVSGLSRSSIEQQGFLEKQLTARGIHKKVSLYVRERIVFQSSDST